ncbi:MAG: IS4 family transposase [Steroidobacteraceae bacterium]
MAIESRDQCARRQRAICREVQKAASQVDSMHFFNLLTSPELLDDLEALLPEYRERRYPPTVTLAMFLGQVLSADSSCQKAVNEAVVNRLLSGLQAQSAATGAYCMARQRMPQQMVRELAHRVAAGLDAHTPVAWRWRGRSVKLVDGSTTLMADTPENQEVFPQHNQQKRGAGFPIARLVGVISLDHGAVLDVALGPYKGKGTGEHGLFRPLKESFTRGDVMVADSYYASYFLIADLLSRGVDFLFEQHGARTTDFRTGEKLGVREHVVQWTRPVRPQWMSAQEYESFPRELTLREVQVGKKVLVTSFLNPREVCKRELGRLFRLRWNVELDLRNIKTTLGMEKLSCKSPQMCEKELWVYMLAYNLIRLLMAQAAFLAGILPRQLSFKHTVQVWVAWSGRQFLSDAPEDILGLFRVIAQVRVGRRPGRLEPRVIKQRPKAFPRLQTTRRRARAIIRRHGRPRRLAA